MKSLKPDVRICFFAQSLFICMLLASEVRSQNQIDPAYLSISDGLASPTVQNVMQDSYGLIWIATTNGLQKYDGYRFETFRNSVEKTTSIQDNRVSDMVEDINHHLWVTTFLGVSRYNRKRNEFTNYKFSNIFRNMPAITGLYSSIMIDSQQRMWVANCDIELLYYEPSTDEWKFAPYEIPGNEQPVHYGISATVAEDSKGGLWSSSSNYGLMYLAKNEKAFKPVRTETVRNASFEKEFNLISDLYFDNNNILWITTRSQIYKYNPETGILKKIREYTEDAVDAWTYLNDIIQDNEGNVWITNNFRGTLKFQGTSDRFEEISIAGKVFSPTHGWNISLSKAMIDRSGIFWIGTRENGLMKYDPVNKPFSFYEHNEKNPSGISPNGVFGLSASKVKPGIVYIGTRGGGINVFDSKLNTFQKVTFDVVDDRFGGSARSVTEDSDGSLWVGTWGDGLIKTDPLYREVKRYKYQRHADNSISGNFVRVIKPDGKGKLWIGTGNGLNVLDTKTGIFHRHLSEDTRAYPQKMITSIESLLKTDNKIGIIDQVGNTENRSLPVEIKSAGKYLIMSVGESDGLISNDFGWMENAAQDTIWSAISFLPSRHSGGASKNRITISEINLQPGSFTLRYKSDDSHSFGNWNEAAPEQTDIYGIALVKSPDDFSLASFENPLEQDRPRVVLNGNNIFDVEIGDKYVWAAANGKGLNRIDPANNTVTYFTYDPMNENSLGSNVITDIYEDSKKNLWLATNQGVNKFDPVTEKFTRYTETDGLPTNLASNIIEGDNGEMWVSTENGIAQMVINEALQKVTFINYNSTDGLGGDTFLNLAAARTPDGRFYFGGDHGLTTFNAIKANRTPPDLLISNLFVSNKSVLDMGESSPLKESLLDATAITLSHGQNNLSFEFSALHYANPKRNQYAHMLKGYDKDWIYDNRNFASYTNLDAGEYEFMIRASNAYGIWNEKGKSLQITILPAWWRTSWAYGGYVIIFLLTAFGVDRLIRRNIRIRARERSRENDLKHAKEIEIAYTNLKATQAQLVQSEKMASLGELTAGIAHEIQNPLNFVKNFSEVNQELIAEMKDEIKAGNLNGVDVIITNIAENEAKIIFHGNRADAIVKGMLQHSRISSGIKEPTNINALADEYLRLAYHGLRAKDKSFNATMKTDFDDSIQTINVVPQDIGRVILNLLTNAFYVVNEKKRHEAEHYEPRVSISTMKTNGKIEIRVTDNGNGIAKKDLDKIFQPFFTTKPTGQGTGLGLSLSYDIITKGHGGELKVETIENEGSTFIVVLPYQ